MDAVATPAAPAAAEQPTQTPPAAAEPARVEVRPVETLTDGERQEWRTKRVHPDIAKAKAPAPAAPATEAADPSDAQAVPVEALSLPDTLKPYVKNPKPPGISKRQHIVNELARTIAEQNAELTRYRQPAAAPAAPTAPQTPPAAAAQAAPAAPAWDGVDPSDPEPQLEQFADAADPYAAHLRAHMRWEDRRDQRVSAFQEQQQRQSAAQETLQRAHVERCTAYEQQRPDFRAKAARVLPQIAQGSPFAVDLMESSVGPQLIDHFADHPEDFQRILRAPDARTGRKAFLQLEARFEAAASSSAPAPAAEPPAPAAIAPKLVSSAPPPPPVLGTRPAEPSDAKAAAIKSGDFTAFRRARLAEDAAKVRR